MSITLLSGDCRDVLPTLAANSVHCVVTSPPYYGLRDYGTAQWDGGDASCDHKQQRSVGASTLMNDGRAEIGLLPNHKYTAVGDPYRDTCGKCGAKRVDRQIGLEATPDEYLATMVAVFREVKRVLRPDGTLWLNLGSSYASGGKRPSQSPSPEHAPVSGSESTESPSSRAPDCAYPDPDGEPPDGSPSHRARTFDSGLFAQPASQPAWMTSRDTERQASLAALPLPLDVQASTTLSSLPNALAVCDLEAPALVGPSDDRTLLGVALHCGDSSASPSALRSDVGVSRDQPSRTHGTGAIDGASASRTAGKVSGSVSCDCGSCGICFAYSAIPMLQFKAKDLMMMPELLALALQADGWFIRSDIIWHKPNPMPESTRDRPTNSYEHVFLLTKSARYFYDAEAVREPHTGLPPEHYGVRSQPLERGCDPSVVRTEFIAGAKREYNPAGRSCRNVWTIATHAFSAAHFATYPPELVERCIRAGTPERGCCSACGAPWRRETQTRGGSGKSWHDHSADAQKGQSYAVIKHNGSEPYERTTTGWFASCACGADVVPATVLDPFAGAGTTLLVADRLQRNAIGIELNAAYTTMAMERVRADAPLFVGTPEPQPVPGFAQADLFAEAAD